MVVNSLATDLRDGEHLVAKAAAETCGNSCSIAVLKNEVSWLAIKEEEKLDFLRREIGRAHV